VVLGSGPEEELKESRTGERSEESDAGGGGKVKHGWNAIQKGRKYPSIS